MEPQPKCYVCPADAVARLMVGSLGVQDALCAEHLAPRQRAYELALTSFHIVSLVRTPERVEDAYKEVVQDLRESERATSETLNALDAANAKVSRLELDCERLARRVAEEKGKVLDRLQSEERLTAELGAEREKVESLSEAVDEARADAIDQRLRREELEGQLTALERLTGVARSHEPAPQGLPSFRASAYVPGGSEAATTGTGSPAAGERGAVVEGSEPPATGR